MGLFEFAAIFLICTITGVLTGLLGIGGGLIVVPLFITFAPFFGLDGLNIHQIIGISATCVFFNACSGLFYRRKETFLPLVDMLKMSVAIVLGSLLGVYLASQLSLKPILTVYSLVCIASLVLLRRDIHFPLEKKRFRALLYLSLFFIGAISAIVGIGGAVLFATALKCFTDKDAKEILPTVTFLVAVNALFAFGGKLFSGEIVPMIIPIAILASLIGAKIGVIISAKLKPQTIANLMAIVLVIALVRVLFELAV